jgi:transcriptional regulator with XRE-family HTH domain
MLMDAVMRLGEWLQKHRVTQAALAGAVGVTPGRISQLAGGEGENPTIELCAKIAAATAGEVTFADLAPSVDVRPMIEAAE